MDIETARRVMDASLSSQPPRYGDWVVAGQTIAKHYRDHPEQLRPVSFHDAKPKRQEPLSDVVRSLRDINARLKRGTRTRDQDAPKRIRKLGPPGSFFSIENDTEGCWLVEHTQEPMEMGEGAQSGERPPSSTAELMNAAGPLPLGEGMMGDRHRAARAARDRGAAWASKQNELARKRWGS